PRSPAISTDAILHATREVLLLKGAATTTAEIARRAGVSEGLLFKRFSSKEELLRAAMRMPESAGWVDALEGLSGKGDARENLVQIAAQLLAFYRETTPRALIVWSHKLSQKRRPPPGESPPARGISALTRYLEREASAGRIKPCDPQIVARVLLGA